MYEASNHYQYVEEEERLGGYGGEGHPMTSGSSDLDRGLYNDLVQIVPLVQSLIDGKSSNSYSKRGSVIFTKAPSKKNDTRNKNEAKLKHGKKQSEKEQDKHGLPDDLSASSVNMPVAKDSEELKGLREELEDLRQKLVEKDQLLKATEMSKNQKISSMQSQVDELKRYAAEKDSVIKTTQQQLNDAKVKLADKQASLEKLQWEAKTSNQKVEKLQEEINSMQSDISLFNFVFEALSKDHPTITPAEDYDIISLDSFPEIDDMEEMEMQKMEEAREAYLAALAIAKEKQDEESLVAASKARLHLQSFVFKSDYEFP